MTRPTDEEIDLMIMRLKTVIERMGRFPDNPIIADTRNRVAANLDVVYWMLGLPNSFGVLMEQISAVWEATTRAELMEAGIEGDAAIREKIREVHEA